MTPPVLTPIRSHPICPKGGTPTPLRSTSVFPCAHFPLTSPP
jgi:hypothetical protein